MGLQTVRHDWVTELKKEKNKMYNVLLWYIFLKKKKQQLELHMEQQTGSKSGCESWTLKKAECQRIDAFELWC